MTDKFGDGGAPKGLDFSLRVPDGDDHERMVCNRCGWIHYVNPRVVVGSVCQWDNKILMCRRNIEPRKGFWTIPAGFLEEGESAEEGAAREAKEEACATIEIDTLFAVYSIRRISQIQLMFRGALKSPDIAVGPESMEVALVAYEDIPWKDLAFPSVYWALRHFKRIEGKAAFAPFTNPAGDGIEDFPKDE